MANDLSYDFVKMSCAKKTNKTANMQDKRTLKLDYPHLNLKNESSLEKPLQFAKIWIFDFVSF